VHYDELGTNRAQVVMFAWGLHKVYFSIKIYYISKPANIALTSILLRFYELMYPSTFNIETATRSTAVSTCSTLFQLASSLPNTTGKRTRAIQ
jgi:hypothetical protein